jgi:hypothetical protein
VADRIELRVETGSGLSLPAGIDDLALRIHEAAAGGATLRLQLRANVELARLALVRDDARAAFTGALAAAQLARSSRHHRLALEAHLVAAPRDRTARLAAAQLALDAAVAAAMHEGFVQPLSMPARGSCRCCTPRRALVRRSFAARA